jgi:predicted esterase
MTSQTTHIVPPLQKHTHTLIFLHGKQSTAIEFESELFESQASDRRFLHEIFPGLKWVFPTAKIRTAERFQEEESSWFDMWSVQNPQERPELQISGIRESIACVREVIKQESDIIGSENIILAGISQGCATAIHALLEEGNKLGGFIGLSSWLPFQEHVKATNLTTIQPELLSSADEQDCDRAGALSTPVFLAHSVDDEVVPFINGVQLRDALEEGGMSVEWREYENGGHWVNEPKGVDDIVSFIQKVMGERVLLNQTRSV